MTQVNRHNGRVAMHGVRRRMVERQAAMVGLPLHVIEFDWAAAENDKLRGTLQAAAVKAPGQGHHDGAAKRRVDRRPHADHGGLVSEIKEEKPDAPPAPDMGGMGGMM